MPTTNLPDPNAYKGTAGFKWHPEGSTDRPEQVHALQWPPHLVPGGGYETLRKKYRATAESFDGSNIERFTAGSGNERARMPLRFDSWAESLGDLLEDAADGVVVDFYPRLESTNLKFPVELVDVGDVTRVRDDSDRHGFGEFEVESVWKDASTDDQGFWWLKSPNKLKNPRLARGTTNGVAERWDTGGITGQVNFSIDGNRRAQRIEISNGNTNSRGRIQQEVSGVLPTDTLNLDFEAQQTGPDDHLGQARIDMLTSTGGLAATTSVDITAFEMQSYSLSLVATTDTVTGRVRFRIANTSTNTGSTASATYRDAKLTLQ